MIEVDAEDGAGMKETAKFKKYATVRLAPRQADHATQRRQWDREQRLSPVFLTAIRAPAVECVDLDDVLAVLQVGEDQFVPRNNARPLQNVVSLRHHLLPLFAPLHRRGIVPHKAIFRGVFVGLEQERRGPFRGGGGDVPAAVRKGGTRAEEGREEGRKGEAKTYMSIYDSCYPTRSSTRQIGTRLK